MTNEYRTAQLAKAEKESREARQRYETAITKKARRAAAEDLEFWSNKSAFLFHARTQEGAAK